MSLHKAHFRVSTKQIITHKQKHSIDITHDLVLGRSHFPGDVATISSSAHLKFSVTDSSYSVHSVGTNPIQVLRKGTNTPQTVSNEGGEPVTIYHGDGILLAPDQWDLLYMLIAPNHRAPDDPNRAAKRHRTTMTTTTTTTKKTAVISDDDDDGDDDVVFVGSPDPSLAPPAAAAGSSSRRSPRKRGSDGKVVSTTARPEKVGVDREPTKLPGVMLAYKWEASVSPKGWHMSEKLDGLRAIWDGHVFQSRTGLKFRAPAYFTKGLPKDVILDGELFVERGKFQTATSIVRSGDKEANVERWRQVTYMVFDVLDLSLGWEHRHAQLKDIFSEPVPFAQLVDQTVCKDEDHLRAELARIEALGGEGVMLRKPKSKYATNRSKDLLKVKSFLDAEAIVLSHNPGSGKHEGLMGALNVENADGVKFKVGTGFTDADRRKPPKKGTVITYRYQELSNDGVPRFPSFVGERIDMPWPPPPTQLGPRTVSLTATPHSQKKAKSSK